MENISKCCSDKGIEYVQLVLEKSVDGFKTGDFSKEYAEELKKQLGTVRVAVLGSYINPSNPNDDELKIDLDKFKEKIKYASVLNPIVVGTETGTYKDGMTNSEEAYQRVLSSIKEVVEEGERYGVNIGIEGVHCFVINTPQMMKRLVDDLNSDNVRVIFDPVNYINEDNYQNQDKIIEDVFELLGDKICVLHAKDFVINDGKMAGTKPGCGLLNYELIMKKIAEYGLDIPIICEEIDEDEANKAFERLEKIINK